MAGLSNHLSIVSTSGNLRADDDWNGVCDSAHRRRKTSRYLEAEFRALPIPSGALTPVDSAHDRGNVRSSHGRRTPGMFLRRDNPADRGRSATFPARGTITIPAYDRVGGAGFVDGPGDYAESGRVRLANHVSEPCRLPALALRQTCRYQSASARTMVLHRHRLPLILDDGYPTAGPGRRNGSRMRCSAIASNVLSSRRPIRWPSAYSLRNSPGVAQPPASSD